MTTTDTTAATADFLKPGGRRRGTTAEIAAVLRAAADRIESVDVADLHLNLGLQPGSYKQVDLFAAAFGVEATTQRMSSGTYHRNADMGPVSFYTTCPPPVTVRREQLLAQLAELDAEEAEQKPAAPVMNGTTCEDITGENEPAAPTFEPGELDGIAAEVSAPVVDPLAVASQQLRETTNGDEFAAAFGGFMTALGQAAEHEQGFHDDCDPARCGDAAQAREEERAEQAAAAAEATR